MEMKEVTPREIIYTIEEKLRKPPWGIPTFKQWSSEIIKLKKKKSSNKIIKSNLHIGAEPTI